MLCKKTFIAWGMALILLLGAPILEGRGKFREAFQNHELEEGSSDKARAYLRKKMEKTHKLNDTKDTESQFQWDFYLFRKFLKSAPKAPILLSDKPRSSEERYHFFRLSTFFSLRSSHSLFEPEENFHIFIAVTLQLALAKNEEDDPHIMNAGREWFKTNPIKENL